METQPPFSVRNLSHASKATLAGRRGIVVLVAVLVAACGSPSQPSVTASSTPVAKVDGLSITVPSTLRQDDSPVQARSIVRLADGSQADTTALKCQTAWSSSAPTVARVDQNGVISPAGGGGTTIAMDCGTALHAESVLRVRPVVVVKGTVLEKYDTKPVASATVTIVDGENAGLRVTSDMAGRFSLSGVVDPPVLLQVASPDFEQQNVRTVALQDALEIRLEPLRREHVFGPPLDASFRQLVVFETHHAGPVTLLVHTDCHLIPYSFNDRLAVGLYKGLVLDNSSYLFHVGLGDGSAFTDSPSLTDLDAAKTVVSPAGVYSSQVSLVSGLATCPWRATVRFPS